MRGVISKRVNPATGARTKRMRWRGNWQSGMTYKAGDVVKHIAVIWIAQRTTEGTPSASPDWAVSQHKPSSLRAAGR
jgi:hypothetical protein